MRWSQFFLHTTREIPKDAEVASHRLMARSGMLRKQAAGIYTYQPLGWRSMLKLMTIVRREMEAAGAIELSMPAVQPAELWHESGRWKKYGKELLRITDRHEREFCFGPTHEEVIVDLVRRDVKSYRQLPFTLYQIQTKFRDEVRPRFGLMRGREFLMKDAYSFHADEESLDDAYRALYDAYVRILEACGLEYTVVEADSGTIGGDSSHEFMVLADTGESAVVRCASCGYGANVEKAETALEAPAPPEGDVAAAEKVATPDCRTIEEVSRFLELPAERLVKTLIYESDVGTVAVAIRGDREINEVKLLNYLDATALSLASEQKTEAATGAPVGFAGVVGLPEDLRLIADESTRPLQGFACGANEADAHRVNVLWDRDAKPEAFVDLLLVDGGDACPKCQEPLELFRGIEVGHIFKLGTVYSEAMGCTFTDEDGALRPMPMGCYGLGVGRTLAAAIEQNHDDNGIIWPRPLAPFEVAVLSLDPKDAEVSAAADGIYDGLRASGLDTLYDDRDQRPGVKFKDIDLVGVPVRVVVGKRSLEGGGAEVSLRRDGERQIVALDAVTRTVEELLTG